MRTVESQLAEIRSRSLLRALREIGTPQQPETTSPGAGPLVNFSSNDYLGLAADPILREAAKACIDQWGVGAGASRLICGTLGPHAALERDLAAFKRTDAAIAFSSGYATALGALGALAGPEDVIILDKLAHASLIDGARLSRATLRVFPHNHLGKLESHLRWARETTPEGRIIVVTESVFSMDGDRAPIEDIVAIKNRYGALLMLDEAHAIGVIGDAGRGLADKRGVARMVDIHMGTLGKALGSAGGYICARRAVIDLLINRARSFIYSTAPLPAAAAAASAAIAFLQTPAGRERQETLWQRLGDFMREAPETLLPAGPVQSAIIPLIIGDEEKAMAASQWLREKGFLVPAIRYPTVSRGSARLRVTLSAAHTREQVSALCAALSRLASS
jgi:8-amino-7-oxononanoate synthase